MLRRHWFLSNMEQAQSNQQSPRMPCFGWASTGSLGKSWGCLQISWNIRKEKYCKVGLLQSTLLQTHAAEIKSCTVGTLCGLKLTSQPLKTMFFIAWMCVVWMKFVMLSLLWHQEVVGHPGYCLWIRIWTYYSAYILFFAYDMIQYRDLDTEPVNSLLNEYICKS